MLIDADCPPISALQFLVLGRTRRGQYCHSQTELVKGQPELKKLLVYVSTIDCIYELYLGLGFKYVRYDISIDICSLFLK